MRKNVLGLPMVNDRIQQLASVLRTPEFKHDRSTYDDGPCGGLEISRPR
jgi:hypothetical protein